MKAKRMVVSAMLALALFAGGIGLSALTRSAAHAETPAAPPASVTLDEDVLNADTSPWKTIFDHWGDTDSVTYTTQGVVIVGTKGNGNAMNFINGPMTIADGSRFEIAFNIPLYNRTDTNDTTQYVRKLTFNLMNGGTTIAVANLWGDQYDNSKAYVTAEFYVVATDQVDAKVTGVHIPKACMEENGSVKLGFDLVKGWYADVVGEDGNVTYQAVDTGSAFTQALSAVTAEEITRVQLVRHTWETSGITSTKLVVKELNGQNLCLSYNEGTQKNELTIADSFNVSALKVAENVSFVKGKSYRFQLLGVGANSSTSSSTVENGVAVSAYAYANDDNAPMGNIAWASGGEIWVTLTKEDGTPVSARFTQWGATDANNTQTKGHITFTPTEAGKHTLTLTFVTSKGYVTVRSVDITVENAPYIELSSMPSQQYYAGAEIPVPQAQLMLDGEQLTDGVTFDAVTVTLNGQPVEIADGVIKGAVKGQYVIGYSATYLGNVYKEEVIVTVIDDEVKSIRVKTPPEKVSYAPGETFDRTGMVVIAVYASGKEVEITDYTIDKEVLSAGDSSVVISYQGKMTPLTIGVKVPEAEGGGTDEDKGGCGSSLSGDGILFAVLAGAAALGACLLAGRSRRKN